MTYFIFSLCVYISKPAYIEVVVQKNKNRSIYRSKETKCDTKSVSQTFSICFLIFCIMIQCKSRYTCVYNSIHFVPERSSTPNCDIVFVSLMNTGDESLSLPRRKVYISSVERSSHHKKSKGFKVSARKLASRLQTLPPKDDGSLAERFNYQVCDHMVWFLRS